jgi:hypothetical protein
MVDNDTVSSSQKYKIYESGFDPNNATMQDEDGIKNFLKNILSANVSLNVLIGSGCSLPAIPIMNETFERLKAENPDLVDVIEKYKTSSFAKEDGDAKNIELFLSWLGNRIDGLSADELKNHEHDVRNFVIDGLIKSIVDGCLENESDSSNQITTERVYRLFLKNLAFIKQLSDDQNDTINLFTPNYDLFIETSLDSLGFAYSDGFKNSVNQTFDTTEYNRRPVDITKRFRDRWSVVKPFFRVYKLHGSLDWVRNDHNEVMKNSNLKDRESSDLTKAVIAPTSSKYADSQGSPFSDLFREFSIELTKSNSMLLINGYGFGDEHINDFILQALGRSDFRLIAFVNEEETNAKRFMKLVGSSAGATFITNEKDPGNVHHFSTLAKLLSYQNPFETVTKDEK